MAIAAYIGVRAYFACLFVEAAGDEVERPALM